MTVARALGPIERCHGRTSKLQLMGSRVGRHAVHAARRSPSICLSQAAIRFQLVKIWVAG